MKYKFMPMFWGDFFANTLHLTAQELGAYTALIGHVWEHDGKIAAADVQRVARVPNYSWHKVRPRIEPFFDVLSTPNTWCHERVATELRLAAEISNKRKAAAMQMHSKSRANSDAKASYLQSHIESFASVREGDAPPMHVQVNYRDPGVEYRSPPRKKSDNVLTPLPDKQLLAAKAKAE